jgi:hypothetical protein
MFISIDTRFLRFDGEMLIVATFLEALSRVATSGDPQNPTAPGMLYFDS